MDDTELEIMIETMINLYGMSFVTVDKVTGTWTVLNPDDVLILTRDAVPHQWRQQTLKDFCLRGKMLKIEWKDKPKTMFEKVSKED